MISGKTKTISSLIVSIMLLGSAGLFAQGYGNPDDGKRNFRPGQGGYGYNGRGHCGDASFHRGFARYDFLKRELGLTDKQVKQIFDIDQKYREKRFENRNNVDRLLELRVEHRKEVKKVMTAEQQKKYDEMFLQRWCGKPGPKRPGPESRRTR